MSTPAEKPRRYLYEHHPDNMAENMRRGRVKMAEAKLHLERKKLRTVAQQTGPLVKP